MTPRQSFHPIKILLFAFALLIAALVREGPGNYVNQAIIWLPTGVAIAGLWLLGLSHWWVITLFTIVQRLMIHYSLRVVLPSAVGSTVEAVLGVVVLQRLGFRPALSRLRDVSALFAAVCIAPLGSIAFSWVARSLVWPRGAAFYSGWDGWWRMNALGALLVVPPALTWLAAERRSIGSRAAVHAALVTAGGVGLLLALMKWAPPGTMGVLALYLALPIPLYAAVRFGPRGATTAGALVAIVIALASTRGVGPFVSVPFAERHGALQLFELTFATLPLLFGALIAERQTALASSRQSEARRYSFQQALPDLTYRIRSDGLCLDVHVPEGGVAVLARDDILSRNLYDFLPPDLTQQLMGIIRRVLDEGTVQTAEYALQLPGRRLVREARCVPYGPDEVLAVVRDITEAKRAAEIVAFEASVLKLVATGRATNDIFAALIAGMERLTSGGLGAIVLLDGNRMHVAMAPSVPAAFNAATEGVEIGPETGSCGAAATLDRCVVVDDIATHPLWKMGRQGALASGLRACWSQPIHDAEGQVLGTLAVYYRETRAPDPEELAIGERASVLAGIALERQRRSEALRSSQDLLASLNRNVSEGLFRVTPGLQLVYANRAFARLFGYDSPEEVLASAGAAAHDDVAGMAQLRQRIATPGGLVTEEIRLRRRDGSYFWGLVSCTEVRGMDDVLLHYDGTIADITARKELEEQFRQAQKMEAVGKLAGGIAHDFNNLLTAIFGYAESIQRDAAPGSSIASHAAGVLHAAERAANLTRQLLAYSRQQILSPQVLDLAAVVDQMGELLRRLIGENIQLVTQHTSSCSRVRVDRGQLEQVIVNLAVNARDAMPAGGTLTLHTGIADVDAVLARSHVDLQMGPYVTLCVRDTGEGMGPDVQARAFDPFFTSKEQGRGTGLGLSTVYGIVKQSGGAVWLESQPGAGTAAWIYLPLAEDTPATEAVASPLAAATVAATVLVVEDEPVVRDFVRETLQRAGFAVLEADDGVAALAVHARQGAVIDLLVTDVVMPRMSGLELARALRRESPGLKVLFMSGYPNETLDLEDFASGEAGFIAKPFASRDLVERTRTLLRPGAPSATGAPRK